MISPSQQSLSNNTDQYQSLNSGGIEDSNSFSNQKLTLEEAEVQCGFQLLTHAGNLTKIIQQMKEMKKAQRQWSEHLEVQHEKDLKQAQKQQTLQSNPTMRKLNAKEKLIQQKKELAWKMEQKKFKFTRNERQKEQFRQILFNGYHQEQQKILKGRGQSSQGSKRSPSRKKGERGAAAAYNSAQQNSQDSSARVDNSENPLSSSLIGSLNPHGQNSFQQYSDLPSNLPQLYFDAIEERTFTQIKIDMFCTQVRRNLETFSTLREELLSKIEGKRAQIKILTDLNQNLKRKYIRKNADYRRALRGEAIDEPKNFFQQLVFDIKRDIQQVTANAKERSNLQEQAIMQSSLGACSVGAIGSVRGDALGGTGPLGSSIGQGMTAEQMQLRMMSSGESLRLEATGKFSNNGTEVDLTQTCRIDREDLNQDDLLNSLQQNHDLNQEEDQDIAAMNPTSNQNVVYHTGDPISINTQIMMLSPNPRGSLQHPQTPEDQAVLDQLEQRQQMTANKMKMQQQIRQLKHMEQLEVKTISERSHEDSVGSMSLMSSKVNTPGGHHKYLSSGGIQRKLQNEINNGLEEGDGGDQPSNKGSKTGIGKQIPILDLLNEICEEADEHRGDELENVAVMDVNDVLAGILKGMDQEEKKEGEEEAETEKEENIIIQKIMNALQVRDEDQDFNSLMSSTDGIYLQNISSEQLEKVIEYLYFMDDSDKHSFQPPEDFQQLVNLFETAEYLDMDKMKIDITLEICKKHEFLTYTNVRRHYIDNLQEPQLEEIYENLSPDILMFVLSDPALQSINQIDKWAYLLGNFYAQFTKARVEYMEKMKDDDSFRFVFDEDLQYLTKEYYEVYNDTFENLKTRDTVVAHLVDFLQLLREDFRQLPFDFHSCFFYNAETKQFQIHRQYLQQDDFKLATNPPPPFKGFRRPLILFSAIEATSFALCVAEVFSLSKRFSQIRILNLRGFVTMSKEQVLKILQSCDQVAHLNLSFVKSVDDEVIDFLGSKFSQTLLSLELRACSNLTDKGIINMCEGFSGIKPQRNGVEPSDEYSRYRQFNRYDSISKLKHLNLADLKQITNKAMKSISFNLFPELVDLSIWGCYKITNEGFLELCTACRSDNFRRVNYCGCYKISDDSRLWISSSFSRVIIYNKVDDFGKELDLDEVVPIKPAVQQSQA